MADGPAAHSGHSARKKRRPSSATFLALGVRECASSSAASWRRSFSLAFACSKACSTFARLSHGLDSLPLHDGYTP